MWSFTVHCSVLEDFLRILSEIETKNGCFIYKFYEEVKEVLSICSKKGWSSSYNMLWWHNMGVEV